jgi:N utilization substance protein A
MEVPEIKDGTVEIKAVAREPGGRSKIAVHSHDEKIDAVGACVGMKGSRVQTVVRELNGERIDVVLWGDDPVAFVTRALSPAKVVHVELDDDEDKVTVVVADDQLSLAIGKGGQNARLAAKLTNLKIDLINESQYSERLEFQKLARFPVSEIPGISERLRQNLIKAGYETADQLSRAQLADLMEIQGIGEKTAVKVVEAAKKKIAELREQFEAERALLEEAEASEEEAEETGEYEEEHGEGEEPQYQGETEEALEEESQDEPLEDSDQELSGVAGEEPEEDQPEESIPRPEGEAKE